MPIPGPGLCDQNEAVSGVAELCLQKRANVGGDGISGRRRIAVVENARHCAGLPCFGAPERLVERLQGLMWVNETFLGFRTVKPPAPGFGAPFDP